MQVWNYLRVSKWWQNFHFWVNYPFNSRNVTINREPVENPFIYVTIQIGWDAKQIAIQLGAGVYMNVCLRGTYCL